MTITAAQKTAIEEVIEIIVATTPARGKRQLSQLFMDLVDRSEWPEYYEVFLSFRGNERWPYPNYVYFIGHTRAPMYQRHQVKR
jgi:hypothetical protein